MKTINNFLMFDLMFVMAGIGVAFCGGVVPLITGVVVSVVAAYMTCNDLITKRKEAIEIG